MQNSFLNKFNGLTTREQTIAITMLLFVLGFVWSTYVYQPIITQKEKLIGEQTDTDVQFTMTQQLIKQLEASKNIDPNLINKNKLKEVKEKLRQQKLQLGIGEKEFVSAHQMAKLLSNILSQNNGLKLITLKSLPVITFTPNIDKKKLGIYMHGVSLTFTGSYLNTLNYLKLLESLPWRFNWDKVEYQVKEYPTAQTTLQLYTLSFEEDWLGL